MTRPPAIAPEALRARLERGEKLIWWDRPIPGLLARRELGFPMLFALVFLGFSLFWMAAASRAGGPFALFGAPFVLVGLWLLSAPIRAYRRARKALYALTDRRALIMNGASTWARPLDRIDFVEDEVGPGGAGHVYFYDEPTRLRRRGEGVSTPYRRGGFLAVADAERVSRVLGQAMRKHGLDAHRAEVRP